MSEFALEMLGITKTFSRVKALDNVTLRVHTGEIHALIGENGAGKSTLMKILTGIYRADAGTVLLQGRETHFKKPQDAMQAGISIIHQEPSLVPDLDAAENLMLGHEMQRGGVLKARAQYAYAKRYLDYVCNGALGDYRVPVRRLSVAQQQMIDIARALSCQARIIVMDEPTASLTQSEIAVLFQIVRQLKADGITILYISHRLEELFALCDRITVLRDGRHVTDANVADVTKNWLIGKMIGRDLSQSYPPRHRRHSDEVVLEVQNLTGERYRDVSFRLHRGEVLAIAGLVGAGRTEVLRGIFGADPTRSGTVKVFGRETVISCPARALGQGLGFATEDRKCQGLFLNQDIRQNIVISALNKVSRYGVVHGAREKRLARRYFDELGVVAPDIDKLCKYLSGGNQQKVILSKWLASGCKILFLDEPTRGIDVGAKYEIFQLMDRLVGQGVSIVMVSSEMAEVIGVADRAIIMHEGAVTGELPADRLTEENIMTLASGETLRAAN
ncbi:MAG: sugar ABC transporter ATP-binding protein [Clostridiales bacterium]|nr:sugar ABC transporter ATP-binding protein [Clostridiales bacterium]